ncbi:hypothetical protein E1265_24360 [Streptomyces sp. 8K308]|uniref:hypothetical protein n=1 Tax=Streptomyces sp. 8K308 TaxID=2530388 RepID=UPI0010520BA6|nr:hypothetical protein [Streptomyces sp. 8K308]TDC19223.1 hypothetical protein E1265_24360 [Streptomyces sp. 8K308]
MPDLPAPETAADADAGIETGAEVTVVTGLEGPVEPAAPVTCSYCGNGIVVHDDHAANCPWHAGKAAAS